MKEDALEKGEDFLRGFPNVRTDKKVKCGQWLQNIEPLCALLKGNAIPATKLHLQGKSLLFMFFFFFND